MYGASFQTVSAIPGRHRDWFDENDADIQEFLSRKKALHLDTLVPNAGERSQRLYRSVRQEVQTKLRNEIGAR